MMNVETALIFPSSLSHTNINGKVIKSEILFGGRKCPTNFYHERLSPFRNSHADTVVLSHRTHYNSNFYTSLSLEEKIMIVEPWKLLMLLSI